MKKKIVTEHQSISCSSEKYTFEFTNFSQHKYPDFFKWSWVLVSLFHILSFLGDYFYQFQHNLIINMCLTTRNKVCVVLQLLSWLTTVSRRLSSTGNDCLPDVSTNRSCKNDASNPKKKRKPLPPLKGVKSLRYT